MAHGTRLSCGRFGYVLAPATAPTAPSARRTPPTSARPSTCTRVSHPATGASSERGGVRATPPPRRSVAARTGPPADRRLVWAHFGTLETCKRMRSFVCCVCVFEWLCAACQFVLDTAQQRTRSQMPICMLFWRICICVIAIFMATTSLLCVIRSFVRPLARSLGR